MADTYDYPFDPTGTASTNLISNEVHTITAVNASDYHTIMPRYAPFFETNCVVTFKDSLNVTRTLTNGTDFYFTHSFISASKACATPVYGSITFLDNTLAGTVYVTYQTLGGLWTLDTATIASILANKSKNPRTTAWEQVVDLPIAFPVIDHEWDLVDMVGVSELITHLDEIRDAILNKTTEVVDSTRFSGRTWAQASTELTTAMLVTADERYTDLSTLRSYVYDNTLGSADVYVKIGTLTNVVKTTWETDESHSTISDLTWVVSGGEGLSDPESGTYLLNGGVNSTGTTNHWLSVTKLTDNAVDQVSFCYTYVSSNGVTTMTVYMIVSNGSKPITAVNMHRGGGGRVALQRIGTAIPGTPNNVTITQSFNQQLTTLRNEIIGGFNSLTSLINAI